MSAKTERMRQFAIDTMGCLPSTIINVTEMGNITFPDNSKKNVYDYNYVDAIRQFKGEYEVFSNFYLYPAYVDGVKVPSNEHAFQAMKTLDSKDRFLVMNARTPGVARRLGRKVKLREDWEKIKIDVMRKLIEKKFSMSTLGSKLLQTGDLPLYEGNTWGDTFWGVDLKTNVGDNHLGVLLMEQRAALFKAKVS